MFDGADSAANSDARGTPPSTSANRTVLWTAAAIGVLLIGFIVLLATSESQQGAIIADQVVGTVPEPIIATTVDSSPFSTGDHRGQWVLVNFFAEWCVGCRVEHPELVEFNRRNSDQAQLVSVAYDDGASVEKYFRENGGDWPLVANDADAATFALTFGVTGVPETVIIDPNGRVAAKLIGSNGVTAAALEEALGLSGQASG